MGFSTPSCLNSFLQIIYVIDITDLEVAFLDVTIFKMIYSSYRKKDNIIVCINSFKLTVIFQHSNICDMLWTKLRNRPNQIIKYHSEKWLSSQLGKKTGKNSQSGKKHLSNINKLQKFHNKIIETSFCYMEVLYISYTFTCDTNHRPSCYHRNLSLRGSGFLIKQTRQLNSRGEPDMHFFCANERTQKERYNHKSYTIRDYVNITTLSRN